MSKVHLKVIFSAVDFAVKAFLLVKGMHQQAGQLLESLIALCEQDSQQVQVGVGVGAVARAAPSARFPSTGYDNLIAGSSGAHTRHLVKEVDKQTMLTSLVLVKYTK